MTYEYLPSMFTCVTLSDTRRTRRLARRLFWKYGLTTHLLCCRISVFSRLAPWIVHHRLPEGAGDDICTLALRHLAADVLACDCQPILLIDPSGEKHLSPGSIVRLESCYLICHESDIDALLGGSTSLAQGDMPV